MANSLGADRLGAASRGTESQHTRLGRTVWIIGLALGLLVAAGVFWLVTAFQRGALRQTDLYLVHSSPLHLSGALTLSHTAEGHTWRAWATCTESAQRTRLRDPARYRQAEAAGLEGAARSIEAHLGADGEDAQTGRELAWALRRWPRERVWVDAARGVLVATGESGQVACLLVTTVPL